MPIEEYAAQIDALQRVEEGSRRRQRRTRHRRRRCKDFVELLLPLDKWLTRALLRNPQTVEKEDGALVALVDALAVLGTVKEAAAVAARCDRVSRVVLKVVGSGRQLLGESRKKVREQPRAATRALPSS